VRCDKTREIVAQLDLDSQHAHPHLVGVFVDETLEVVSRTLDTCGLDYAQLHGSEPPEMVAELMNRGHGVIKAFRVKDAATLGEIAGYCASAHLLDTFVSGQPGGTGHIFDWAVATEAAEYGPVILAGGLTPANVAQAIQVARPWGVDVSSGVEASPGKKDIDKMRRFINAAKSV
jgi:phosphoribosylanthranilate isomerase